MMKQPLKRSLERVLKKQKLLLMLLLFLSNSMIEAQNCVSGACNPNTFVNSTTPNTIEYDNFVSIYHSTLIKEADGTFKVWGQRSAATGSAHLLSPTEINSANNFNYTGTPLKATGGSIVILNTTSGDQFALLTTDGLYVWGTANTLISSSIKNTAAFGKISVDNKTDGLPPGVSPTDVKMLFGSYGTLAITTCSGEAWVLSFEGNKNGDGTAQDATNSAIWHRVKTSATTDLTNVVAVRGTSRALFALTSEGKLYTWGTATYLNDGTAATNRTYATQLNVLAGVTPKMIGMTQTNNSAPLQSYYLLATDGRLFSMGNNSQRQLGDGSTTARATWVQPQKVTNQSGQGTGVLDNIAWISPNEHSFDGSASSSTAAINVLTNNNKLWAWGANHGKMIGGATDGALYDPLYMPGNSINADGLAVTDEVIAVETGGHTSMNVKKGNGKFGYVGHRVAGSMGDGSSANTNIDVYSYTTNIIDVCGAQVLPYVKNIEVCQGTTTANLNTANLETTPAQIEWHATNDVNSPVMTNITAVGAGTYYAFFTAASGRPRTVSSAVTVTGVPCCSTGNCNPNAFVNSSDPNTIEYDNIVSTFHSTIVKESDGTFKVWGDKASSDGSTPLYNPMAITPANGFNYTGTPLKATGGAANVGGWPEQRALLTTDGLYVWGSPNGLISSTIKNTALFGKISVNGKADGLPPGVIPGQVKMMFGSYQTLAIVTCSGEAWVLSFLGNKNGDGTAQDATNNIIWHRVRTSATGNPYLTDVVAMRGTPYALFALTSNGNLYTWGTGTYINDGNAASNRTYATPVTVSPGVTPKMIGMMSGASLAGVYYLLATDGRLFTMGNNSRKQLGDGTTTTRTNWVQPQKPASQGQGTGSLENIVWISPSEHGENGDGYLGAINVLTNNNKQWAWGYNAGYMIGGATDNTQFDPIYMPGVSAAANGLKVTDEIIAVETSIHMTMNIKKGSDKFGYVGHRVSGSMGDGGTGDQVTPTYTYNTSILMVCAANLGPAVKDLVICQGATANLNNANLEATPSEVEWHATNDASSAVMTNITAVAPGTYYAFYTVASGKSRTMGSPAIVSYYTAAAPSLSANSLAINCPATTANLNSLESGTTPAGSTLVWFTNSAHTGAAYATPTAATAGTYYAFYQNTANSCYSSASSAVTVSNVGSAAPIVNAAVSNNCPSATVNLNTQAYTAAVPVGSTLVWFTNNAHTGAAYATPETATAGTYYAFYHNTSNGCYSEASAPVTVTINACTPCTASAGTQTVNLSSITVAAAPAGSVLQWHNSATPSATTQLSSTTVNATATPTNYWAFYYDSTNTCYSPGAKVTVVSNSCCNYPTVNLSALPHGTVPNGSTLVWYTTSTRTAGTQVTNPIAVGNGTYWPFFYDATNTCYSPVGTPVMVAIDSVCPVTDYGYIYVTKKALDENSSVDFNFTVNGGPVTAFTLNDKETNVNVKDLGSSESGRLWAVASNGTLYYRNTGSSDWVQTSVTTAVKVDGGSASDCYFTNASGQVSRYDGVTTPTVIGSPANYGSSNAVDVGSAWNATPYIITANQTVWMYSGSGTTWAQVGTTTNNVAAIDADPSTGDAFVNDGTLVYRLTSAGVKTSLGAPGYIDDIAVTSAGEVFITSVGYYVRKWNSGTTWNADETSSRMLAGRITAGHKEQVWSTNPYYSVRGKIYTRTVSGTTIQWLDDERVRTSNKGNSIMIKVPVGTYTVKETATSGWELQSMDVYDPTSNSISNFADKSVTLNVGLNETVNAVFTNGLVNPFVMGNDCTTVFFEDFGSGAVGSYGAPLAGQTSYHYNEGNVNPTQDGYYSVVGSTTDFAWWSTPSTFDHTSNDGTGRMMAINASYDQGVFFRRKFTSLVPGKSYKFSAWLMSMSNDAIKPNATFQVIDPATGVVLNQVSTSNITTHHVWNEYSMNFVPTSTELDLVLLNNAPGGDGNDIALDDIRFEMNKPQNLAANRDCSASTLTVTAPLGAIYEYSIDNVNWQASPSFTGVPAAATSFYVRYSDAISCVSSAPLPSCYCYKPGATTGGSTLDTKVGITALGRAGATDADNWPMARKGGWIALESKTKGFVPNRVAFSGGNPVGIVTSNFVEGMMVYDTTNKCLKVYTLKDGDSAMAWHCVTTQACPD